ncbi:MAG TPA: A24 family peptidase [Actinopolymorphaceae bacterium]
MPISSPGVSSIGFVTACAAAGSVVGFFLPLWIKRLPEPQLVGDETKIPYVELATWAPLRAVCAGSLGLCWGLVAWRLGFDVALPVVFYLALAGVVLGYVDLRVRLLPNAVVLPSYAVVAGLLILAATASGDWRALVGAAGGGAAVWAFLAVLGLIAPSGMGFGDVKLGGVLGLGLGWFGPGHVLIGVMVAFAAGGLASLVLITLRRATRKSAVPFGPFLVLGFVVAVTYGDSLIEWYAMA